jgi:hypothetical protein
MDNISEYQRNGLTVAIHNDDYPEDPTEWALPSERQVYYALKHNSYRLPWEIDADTADYSSYAELAEAVTGKGGELEGYNYKFVRWYEHSGVSLSLRDGDQYGDWDAGCAGVIFAQTTKEIEANFADYAAYIEGDVYGYIITNPKDGEIIDSCSGFYGYDYVESEANAIADAYVWPHEAAYAKKAQRYHI